MAVKIECNICTKFIKDVRPEELGSITGKEICTDCGHRIDTAFGLVAKEEEAFKSDLEGMFTFAKKKFMSLDDVYNKMQNKANDLFLRTRKELESLKNNIIENK